MLRLPTLFISHGAPDILLRQTAATDALRKLGHRLPELRGIVIVSAHWIDEPVGITRDEHLKTIHDFGSFPQALYSMQYPARGDEELSDIVQRALEKSGIASRTVAGRGLDHGAWIPLRFLFPDARIPVVQVSLPAGTLQDIGKLGVALAPLRQEGVLIIGSGGSVHNLRAVNLNGETEEWATEFETWLRETVEENHFNWLVSGEHFPPSFRQAHPTVEHFAPLIVAWAAAGSDQPGRRIHHSFDYGNIGMSMFSFGNEHNAQH